MEHRRQFVKFKHVSGNNKDCDSLKSLSYMISKISKIINAGWPIVHFFVLDIVNGNDN